MNYESARFLELDARDSDLQSLPDAPDASIGNLPMLSIPVFGLVLLILACVGVVASVRWALS